MSALGRTLRVSIALCAVGALAGGVAGAAFVQVGDLILRADGGFRPNALPRRAFAPIDFQGHADLSTRSGALPPALQRAIIDFDRDGRLRTAGLARCDPEQVSSAAPEEARTTCRGAIVGRGHVSAVVGIPGLPREEVSSPLTLFNGPSSASYATVVIHAQFTRPAQQTFAVLVQVQRRRGASRYRATLDVPPVAGGYGALTHVDVKVGRRYRARGKRRSYIAARCSDNVLSTHGRFTFSDGTVVDGSVMKGCRIRR